MSAAIVLVVAMSGSLFLALAAAIVIVLVTTNKTPSPSPPSGSPPAATAVEIQNDGRYTIALGNEYLAQDFDASRPKGEMCDAATTTDASKAAAFKFTKSGDAWSVATDCDGDGNWTSFLNGSSDLIRARDKDTPDRQLWTVACTADGCTFKNKHKDAYLGGTFTKPSFNASPVTYRVTKA